MSKNFGNKYMCKNFGNKWLRWALINLVLVALYGTLMRYKIAFNFPYLEQKNLLHAHSHFAFAGWISHVLYTGLAIIIGSVISEQKIKKYNLLILNKKIQSAHFSQPSLCFWNVDFFYNAGL